jgi:hypothetical protein
METLTTVLVLALVLMLVLVLVLVLRREPQGAGRRVPQLETLPPRLPEEETMVVVMGLMALLPLLLLPMVLLVTVRLVPGLVPGLLLVLVLVQTLLARLVARLAGVQLALGQGQRQPPARERQVRGRQPQRQLAPLAPSPGLQDPAPRLPPPTAHPRTSPNKRTPRGQQQGVQGWWRGARGAQDSNAQQVRLGSRPCDFFFVGPPPLAVFLGQQPKTAGNGKRSVEFRGHGTESAARLDYREWTHVFLVP